RRGYVTQETRMTIEQGMILEQLRSARQQRTGIGAFRGERTAGVNQLLHLRERLRRRHRALAPGGQELGDRVHQGMTDAPELLRVDVEGDLTSGGTSRHDDLRRGAVCGEAKSS